MDQAFEWIGKHPLCANEAYLYLSGDGDTGICQTDCEGYVSLAGHVDVPEGDESSLVAAISRAPVSVGVEVCTSFQLYAGGVLDDPTCSTTMIDHGVLAVGYVWHHRFYHQPDPPHAPPSHPQFAPACVVLDADYYACGESGRTDPTAPGYTRRQPTTPLR